MTTPECPRTRHPERTRARLIEEATREFAAHGYDGARVERMVRAAADLTPVAHPAATGIAG